MALTPSGPSVYTLIYPKIAEDFTMFIIPNWLVVSTPLKNISQLGLLFPIYRKVKFMFQTTNQSSFPNIVLII